MVPTVKLWVVTLVETGQKFEVLAPTKLLAKLNFRHEFYLAGPVKIGLARRK